MSNAGEILSVSPRYAIGGGEIAVECKGFRITDAGYGCTIGGIECGIVGASSTRVLALVPEEAEPGRSELRLMSGGEVSERYEIVIGARLADDMHIVANPAVDPKDNSIYFTRSGSRGQELANTLYRLEPDGYVDELPAQVKNPTGLAFDEVGDLYVSNRADGEIYRVLRGEEVQLYASHLGIATGIAFDSEGVLYVGDRSGTIYRIPRPSLIETFAVLEPSVAAYHLAIAPDGDVYVTAPGLASSDRVYRISPDGTVNTFFNGLGRPQGLAFDTDGNLYVAGCYRSRRGIVRIAPGGSSARHFLAGMNVVGICFTRGGDMIVATGESIYSVPAGVYGTLLS